MHPILHKLLAPVPRAAPRCVFWNDVLSSRRSLLFKYSGSMCPMDLRSLCATTPLILLALASSFAYAPSPADTLPSYLKPVNVHTPNTPAPQASPLPPA